MSRQADTEQYISSDTDSGFTGLSLKIEVEGRNKKVEGGVGVQLIAILCLKYYNSG